MFHSGLQNRSWLKSVELLRNVAYLRINRCGHTLLPETAFLQHAVFSQVVQSVISEVSSEQQPPTSQILLLQFCQIDTCIPQQLLTKPSTNQFIWIISNLVPTTGRRHCVSINNISSFCVFLTMLSVSQIIYCKIVRRFVNNELKNKLYR